ncbi:MAG: site-specific integrase [Methyloceanibacter sp.]
MPKITKRVVDATVPKAKLYIVWDCELKGFGLQVLPTGIKSYVFQYRTPEGRPRRITIGKHGEWTPTQARDRAEEYRQTVRAGSDPAGQKRALLEAATVGELLDAYLASESFKDKAPSTQTIDRGRIERHLRPLLGKRHAHLLTDNDIRRALAAIRDGKTSADIKTRKRGRARVKGGAGTARMSIDLLRVIFNFAIRERLVKVNPCVGVKTGSSGTRETILDDAADYARLFQTLDRMELERRIRAPVADAIRLIALTGCRRGEAAGLRWSHVDLQHGRLVLPPTAHKTGRKTGKPRTIILPSTAQAIIAQQPEGQPQDFVFAPARGNNALALSKAWRKVRAEANLPADIGLHGLRHSLASHMAMAGAQAPEIMQVVGHRQLSTVQRYIHFAETAQATLAERAASIPLAGMAAASKPKGTLLPIKAGRP